MSQATPHGRPAGSCSQGQPLREVLATLERYRYGRIVVLDSRAADRKISGIADLRGHGSGVAGAAQDNLPVSVTHPTGMMVVVRSR